MADEQRRSSSVEMDQKNPMANRFVGGRRNRDWADSKSYDFSAWSRSNRPFMGARTSSNSTTGTEDKEASETASPADAKLNTDGEVKISDSLRLESAPFVPRMLQPSEAIGLPPRSYDRKVAPFVAQADGESGFAVVQHNDDPDGIARANDDERPYSQRRAWAEEWLARPVDHKINGVIPRAEPGPVRMDVDAVHARIRADEDYHTEDKTQTERTLRECVAALNQKYSRFDDGKAPLSELFERRAAAADSASSGAAMADDKSDDDDSWVNPLTRSFENLHLHHRRLERERRQERTVRTGENIEDEMEAAKSDRLRKVRELFRCAEQIQSASGITFEPMQRDFFREFAIACGPSMYGAEWPSVQLEFMMEFGLSRHSQNVLALTPRRFGKTWIVCIFVLAFILTNPGKKIVIIGQNKRTSILLLKLMKQFLTARPEWKDRIALDSADHLAVLPEGVGKGMTASEKRNNRLLSTVWALPSTSDGSQA